jgi:transposase InsO family protein
MLFAGGTGMAGSFILWELQRSQFTSHAFTSVLEAQGVTISMNGCGRRIDDVFIERLWRSLKDEEVYLHAYENLSQARIGIDRYVRYYNGNRKHASLGRQTPGSVCARAAQGYTRPARHPRSTAALTPRPCS